MEYETRYADWLLNADEDTKRELDSMTEAQKEDSFYTELSFGTAGLRGIIGAGTNRMNVYVVRRATQGLCDYLKSLDENEPSVVIAYDSRRYSDTFALEAALTLAKNGIRAYLFESLRSVPQLSFALLHLKCSAGIMITASHNPAAYNGYKVYWSHGGQLGPNEASAVLGFINRIGYFDVTPASKDEAIRSGLIRMIGEEIDEAYYAATKTLMLNPDMLREYGSKLNIVYTPLHGAGNIPVRTLLNRIGVTNVHVVKEQAMPDPEFSTVRVPNPEDPSAFELAVKLANEIKADAILATDPDSDRLGAAARDKDGSFKLLTGNQIGCLLIEYMLSTLKGANKLPDNALIVKSIVSTCLADAICESYGVRLDDVLTGFRFISEKIDESLRTKAHTFLFGFEESYGFLAGGFSRDKDAVCASMLLAEACVFYSQKGMTLLDAMDEIYKEYGYFIESVKSYTLTGKAGMEKIAYAMRALREKPIEELYNIKTLVSEDYLSRARVTLKDGSAYPIALPQSDMIRYLFEDGSWMVARPSGTEPKLKLYIGTMARDKAGADALSKAMLNAADKVIKGYLGD